VELPISLLGSLARTLAGPENLQKAEESAETIEQLHAKFGQVTMENDFLERGLERIHGPREKK
jgi:hypothetical protein